MKHYLLSIYTVLLALVFITGCSKQTEDLYVEGDIHDYMPMEVGKYLIYQLDSTALLPFGTGFEIRSFQMKDTVEAEITDNLNRPSFRVVRYLRAEDGTGDWEPVSTYMVTPLSKSIQVVEDNLRFVKLMAPLREGFSWKGNSYIDTYSPGSLLTYLDNWDYYYENLNFPYSLPGFTADSTITIQQRDEQIGDPGDKMHYNEKNYSVEVYAKGIGLVFKEFIHHEYQAGNTPPSSGKYMDGSYGFKITLIDHN
jgi:hypothetical protein